MNPLILLMLFALVSLPQAHATQDLQVRIDSGFGSDLRGVGQEVNVHQKGVPFLSKIPLIGGFFRGNRSEKTGLVVYAKPEIVQNTEV